MQGQQGRFFESDDDPSFHLVIKRLRKGKTDMVDVRKKHVCSSQTCNPQSEEQMVRSGTLDGEIVSNNVYLCKYGVVHVCSATSCKIFPSTQTQTCTISGFQMGTMVSSYDKNDYRTWNKSKETETTLGSDKVVTASAPKKRDRNDDLLPSTGKEEPLPVTVALKPLSKRPRPLISERVAKEKSADIITNLMYSSARGQRNAAAIQEFRKEAMTAKNTYVQQRLQMRQLPYLTDVYRLIAHFTSKALPLVEFEPDLYLIEYYSCVVYQIWLLVLRYFVPEKEKVRNESGEEILPRIDLETVCLGVLFGMRQGLSFGGVSVLPYDEFLASNLPLISELSYFGIVKNKITAGNTILVKTYQNALKEGAIPQDLVLDVTKLPEKNKQSEYKKLDKNREIIVKKDLV